MANIIIPILQTISWIFVLAVIVDVILSYFMSPYHPVRKNLDRFVDIFLNPIRKLMPKNLGIDFSPVVFILLVQMIEYLLISLVITIG